MKILRMLLLGLLALLLILTAGAALTPLPGERLTTAGWPRNSAQHVSAADGVRLAVDVWLPADLAPDEPVPALVEGSRYWRATRVTALGRVLNFLGLDAPGANPGNFASFFNERGYAYVTVDVRGTGASFGVHDAEYSREEMSDYGAVLDWIVSQPWSNGRVGAVGVSYAGTTAELMTTTGHAALRAVAPLYADFDVQQHLVRPGGVYQPAFVEAWNDLVSAMDRDDLCSVAAAGAEPLGSVECLAARLFVGGVKPVDGPEGARLLEEALAEHNSPDVAELVSALEHRDSPWGNVPYTAADALPYGRKAEIEASGVPMFVVTGWSDAATSDGALARFASFSNPQTVTIGPFSHGGAFDTNPYQNPEGTLALSREEQLDELETFFAAHLKGPGAPSVAGLRYYVQGGEGFRRTDRWPPAHVEPVTFYFDADGLLARQAPETEDAAETHEVSFLARTGGATRWMTQLGGGDVRYPDRESATADLLRYETEPFAEAVELTGVAVASLWLSANRDDGAVHVYLDDVGPNGSVRYLTEGVLRLLHRASAPGASPYPTFGPERSFLEEDAAPMPLREAQEVVVPLFATSALVKAGHRLRLSLSGADATSFARYPGGGPAPTWRVHRSASHPSSLTLPLGAAD